MKIGFDAKRAFHNDRGLGNYARSLIEGLVQFYPQYQYYLYTPKYSRTTPFLWDPPSEVTVRTPGSAFDFFSGVWRSLYLAKEMSLDGLNIYHGLSHELPWRIEKRRLCSLVTIHDLIAFRMPHLFPWLDRQVYRKKIFHSCKRADLIIAICEQTKRDIEEYLDIPEKKIKVLYQSIHPRFYERPERLSVEKVLSKWGIDFPYILFVGALEERKNVLGLVRAYSSIRQNNDYGLILVGRGGDYQKKVEKLITDLKIEKRVKILSRISSEELPAFYAGSTLFCYPSFFEGFGLPIAEAFFCGSPVITSKGSCFPEVGGEGAVYIDPHDVSELVSALESVLDSQEKRTSMVRLGREHVQKFHQQKTTANLVQVYQDMAGK